MFLLFPPLCLLFYVIPVKKGRAVVGKTPKYKTESPYINLTLQQEIVIILNKGCPDLCFAELMISFLLINAELANTKSQI